MHFQNILLAAHDLDDAINERARQLAAGPEPEPAKPTETTTNRFEAFWKAYPRKTSKKDAEHAFNKVNPSRELYLQMMTALENQKTWQGWQDGYIPEAARWLNGEKWNDEKPAERTNSQPKKETRSERVDRLLKEQEAENAG